MNFLADIIILKTEYISIRKIWRNVFCQVALFCILGQPVKDDPPSPTCRKNQKKLAFFFIFALSSFLKEKQFPIIDEPKAVSYTDQSKTPAFHNNSAQHKGGKPVCVHRTGR